MANNMPRPKYGKAPSTPTLDDIARQASVIIRRPVVKGRDTRTPARIRIRK